MFPSLPLGRLPTELACEASPRIRSSDEPSPIDWASLLRVLDELAHEEDLQPPLSWNTSDAS